MRMKDGSLVSIEEGCLAGRSPELAAIRNDNVLKHMIVENSDHVVESSDIGVQSRHHEHICNISKVGSEAQIGGVVADRSGHRPERIEIRGINYFQYPLGWTEGNDTEVYFFFGQIPLPLLNTFDSQTSIGCPDWNGPIR